MASEPLIALLAALGTAPTPTLDDFEATLARRDSATLALEDWCAARGIAKPAKVIAEKVDSTGNAAPSDLAARLELGPHDTAARRSVRLACGKAVLSVAWNWYVPSRLTPTMAETLRTTDTPFGKIVAPLGFRREALETVAGAAAPCPEGTISTHRARLILPDGRPLAYVIECYTGANLTPMR